MKIYITCAAVLGLFLSGCMGLRSFVQPQQKELYEIADAEDTLSINGFKELSIFSENIDNSVWVSPEKNCVTMSKQSEQVFAGQYGLRVTWDKVTGGCKWVGMGFGWNDWQPKDMSEVIDEAAIQFQVRAVKGSFTNLPVAFAIEDYTGVQTYYGFNTSLTTGPFNDAGWRTVTIPLSKFPFQSKDADVAKVKQFMIQLEGDGDVYMDEFKIVKLK